MHYCSFSSLFAFVPEEGTFFFLFEERKATFDILRRVGDAFESEVAAVANLSWLPSSSSLDQRLEKHVSVFMCRLNHLQSLTRDSKTRESTPIPHLKATARFSLSLSQSFHSAGVSLCKTSVYFRRPAANWAGS